MNESLGIHKHRKFQLFNCNELELLIFDYEYGKSEMFIRFFKPKDYREDVTQYQNAYEFGVWYELPGGVGTENGRNKHGSSELPLCKTKMSIDCYTKLMDKSKMEFEAAVFLKHENYVSDWHILHQVKLENEEILFGDDYVMLPDNRKLSYALKSSNDKLFVITDNLVYHGSYNTTILRIGNPIVGMKELIIKEFMRLRDGGTTIIRTEEGIVIYFPTIIGGRGHAAIAFENEDLFKSDFAQLLKDANVYLPTNIFLKYATDKSVPMFELSDMDEHTIDFFKKILNLV